MTIQYLTLPKSQPNNKKQTIESFYYTNNLKQYLSSYSKQVQQQNLKYQTLKQLLILGDENPKIDEIQYLQLSVMETQINHDDNRTPIYLTIPSHDDTIETPKLNQNEGGNDYLQELDKRDLVLMNSKPIPPKSFHSSYCRLTRRLDRMQTNKMKSTKEKNESIKIKNPTPLLKMEAKPTQVESLDSANPNHVESLDSTKPNHVKSLDSNLNIDFDKVQRVFQQTEVVEQIMSLKLKGIRSLVLRHD
ncbi:hypothetical protein BC833DRAFT_606345 [Globomyces pollinis-pini]|nr:hypothetical protein BC833DRAFT_606345 [Globomyces pollinis-pini]